VFLTNAKTDQTQSNEATNKELIQIAYVKRMNDTGNLFNLQADDVEWRTTDSNLVQSFTEFPKSASAASSSYVSHSATQ
jgi:uncharacterized protein YegL